VYSSNEGLCELRLKDRRGSSEGMVWYGSWDGTGICFCVMGFHTDSSGRRGWREVCDMTAQRMQENDYNEDCRKYEFVDGSL
jgi:hypothetical protein